MRGCSGEESCIGRGLDKCYPDLGPDLSENPVEIQGLPIAPNTIVYYYTYGSVLSALSRRADNRCSDAMKVFTEVRAELNNNPDAYTEGRQTIISIVQAGESICQSLGDDSVPASSVTDEAVTSTPEAGIGDVTATPTP